MMTTPIPSELSHRDRAVLRAVCAGRCCVMTGDAGMPLLIDGLHYCDQFAGSRLTKAGLIAISDVVPGAVALTARGYALLEAA